MVAMSSDLDVLEGCCPDTQVYTVTVKTSDIMRAGTDAKVSLVLHGALLPSAVRSAPPPPPAAAAAAAAAAAHSRAVHAFSRAQFCVAWLRSVLLPALGSNGSSAIMMLPPQDEAFIRDATSTYRLRLCPVLPRKPKSIQYPGCFEWAGVLTLSFGGAQDGMRLLGQKDVDYWWLPRDASSGACLTDLGDILKIEIGAFSPNQLISACAPCVSWCADLGSRGSAQGTTTRARRHA